MDIQNFIARSLLGTKGLPSGEFNGTYNADVLKTNFDSLPLPIRQCEFVMQTSFDGFENIIFCTGLTVPQTTLDFDFRSRNGIVTPKTEFKPGMIQSIIPRGFKSNVMNLYTRQFYNGLFCLDVEKPDLLFSIIDVNDEFKKDLGDDALPIPEGIDTPSEVLESTKMKKPDADTSGVLHPYLYASSCVFGAPVFSTNPSSPEFLIARLNFYYENLIYNKLG